MRIREVKLTEANLETLDDLDFRLFPADSLYPKPGAIWWIGSDDLGPFCFGGLKDVGDQTAFLCRVGVQKAYRGLGIHRRLIRIREAKARRMGFKWIVTYTHGLNFRSAGNLLRLGYHLYEPATPYGVDGALYFRKGLK